MNEDNLCHLRLRIITDAHKAASMITERARDEANKIMEAARVEAEASMKKVLAETGTWVEGAHDKVNPVVRVVQKRMCVQGTQGRAVLDALLGAAKDCYCCSAIRGFTYGMAFTVVAVLLVHLAFWG